MSVSIYGSTGSENGLDHGLPRALFMGMPSTAERIGDPIYFGFGSAKLEQSEIDKIKTIAIQIGSRADGNSRVRLLSSADRRGSDIVNNRLAQERGAVVEGELLSDGIQVDRIVSVGKNRSPEQTPEERLQDYRTVQVFVVRQGTSDEIVLRDPTLK
jgi:outer membrane protein OmpA-like peptidoglycan-associated protein